MRHLLKFARAALSIRLGFLVCLAALVAGTGRAADESGEKIITKTFAVEPGGSVSVATDQGDIELVTGKQNTVEVVVERITTDMSDSQTARLLKKQKVTASLEGNAVYVEVGKAKAVKEESLIIRQPGLEVHIKVTVPKRFDARLETSGGNIAATGLEGAVEAKTAGGDLGFTNIHGLVNGQSGGGNIRVKGGSDKLQVRTSGGTIEIRDFNGPAAQADSLGGNISVAGCTGTLAVKTSGGNVSVEDFTGPQAYADTAGGTVAVELGGALLSDSYLRTSGGNITVKMAEGVAVNLTATTDGGNVTTAIPVSAEKKGRIQDNRVEGQINGGGPKLLLKTGGGNIEILKK